MAVIYQNPCYSEACYKEVELYLMTSHMNHVTTKPTRSDINRTVQPQKMVRGSDLGSRVIVLSLW